MKNKSLMLNIGFLFSSTYFLYFLSLPFLFFLDNKLGTNLGSDSFIYVLYTKKGLRFATEGSIYIIISGLIAFLTGYYIFLSEKLASKNWFVSLKFFNREWSYRNIYITAVIVFSGGLLSKVLGVLKGAHLHFHFSSSLLGNNLLAFFSCFNILHFAALALFTFGYLKSKEDNDEKWHKIFKKTFISVLIAMILISFNFGGKVLTLNIIFPVIVIFSYFGKNQRNQIILFLMLALFSVGIMMAKDLANRTMNKHLNKNNFHTSVETFLGRVAQNHVVTEVTLRSDIKHTTRSFHEMIQFFKPKQFRKSVLPDGNTFGQKYGFITNEDNNTGVGRTILGAFFQDYGITSVIIGMFLVGLVFRFIQGFSITNMGIIFYSIVLTRLLSKVEQNFVYLVDMINVYFLIALFIHLTAMRGGFIDIGFNILNKILGKHYKF